MNPHRAQQRAIALEQEQQHRTFRKLKFVHQSCDGQLVFLHPHNYNMLKHDVHHDCQALPPLLAQCTILQIDHFEQSHDVRRRFPFLGFIPFDVSFIFVEVDLSKVVSAATLRFFEKQTLYRQQQRVEREEIIRKEAEHRKVMEQQRVALQRQKYMAPQIDIHDLIEFPSLTENHPNSGGSDHSDHSGGHRDERKTSVTSPVMAPSRGSKGQKSWSQMLTLQKTPSVEDAYLTPSRPTKVTVSQRTAPLNVNASDPAVALQNGNGNGNTNGNGSGDRKHSGSPPGGGGKRKRRRRGRDRKKNKKSSPVH